MGPLDLLLAPVRATQLGVRALQDLHALAERTRRHDPVEDVRDRLDEVLDRLDALTGVAALIEAGGRDLTATAKDLNALTMELISGGRDLTETAEDLEGDTARLEAHLRTVLAALPRLLEGLRTVEALEGAAETLADTVEPLQGTAERVGRVAQRFSRS